MLGMSKWRRIRRKYNSVVDEAVIVTALTSVSGNHIIIDFDKDITGTTNIHDFTVKVDGMVDDITMANMLALDRIELTLATPIINTDTNIIVSHYGGGDTNMAIFLDYPVTNTVPVVIADPVNDAEIDSAFTSVDGNTVTAIFDRDITGIVTIDEFLIVSDQENFTLGSITVVDHTIEIQVLPPITNADTNILMSFAELIESNIVDFTDQPVASQVPAPAPAPDIDLDGDGLPDTIIYEQGDIMITEDDDSYQVDLDGDGIEDIHVDK